MDIQAGFAALGFFFACLVWKICLLNLLFSDKTLRKQQEMKWPQTWEGKSACVRKGEIKFDFFN